MPLAEWSNKAAVENQQHIEFTFQVRKAERLPLVTGQAEIRGGGVQGNSGHVSLLKE